MAYQVMFKILFLISVFLMRTDSWNGDIPYTPFLFIFDRELPGYSENCDRGIRDDCEREGAADPNRLLEAL